MCSIQTGTKQLTRRLRSCSFSVADGIVANRNNFTNRRGFLRIMVLSQFRSEYRVKSRNDTTPFECVQDGKSAIRWVRSHAKELGIDPDKIVAAGGSAGGHVAVCTGIIEGHENKDEDLSASSVPNAMVLFNPVLDTTEKGFGAERFAPDRQTEISPNHHIHAGIVPTILFHGTADKTVPFENAETFAKLMKEAGNTCELEIVRRQGPRFFQRQVFSPKNQRHVRLRAIGEGESRVFDEAGLRGEIGDPLLTGLLMKCLKPTNSGSYCGAIY